MTAIRTPIPLSLLFTYPQYSTPRLSPCGTYLSHISNSHAPTPCLIITNRTNHTTQSYPLPNNRPGCLYDWAHTSAHIFFLSDPGNDEVAHLYVLDLATGCVTDRTPHYTVTTFQLSADHPHEALLTYHDQNPATTNVGRYSLLTDTLTVIEENEGTTFAWIADSTFTIRARTTFLPDGSLELQRRIKNSQEWIHVLTWSPLEIVQSRPLCIAPDNTTLYITDCRQTPTAALASINLDTGLYEELFCDPAHDVFHQTSIARQVFATLPPSPSMIWSPDGMLAAFSYHKERITWVQRSPLPRVLHDHLMKHAHDTWIEQQTPHGTLIGRCSDIDTPSYWLYDNTTQSCTHLGESRPQLKNYTRSHTAAHTIKNRHGDHIYAYLTMPSGASTAPLIIKIHGGPWARDIWGFNPEIQLLASRGYASLQINYRGSTGYGSAHLNAGNKELGGGMIDDIFDATQWAINQGITTQDTIAFMGRSYGGFAALCAAHRYPEHARCVIAQVPPTDLSLLIQNAPAQWKLIEGHLAHRIGSLPEDGPLLHATSPNTHAHTITVPLLISYGVRDQRVSCAHAQSFLANLNPSAPLTVVPFADEGHYNMQQENALRYEQEVLAFLGQYFA